VVVGGVTPPLLILDLDETLVYAVEGELSRPADFRVGPYAVYCRPHLARFLDYCFSDFAVAVWTSSGRSYAGEVVDRVFQGRRLQFFWTYDRCTQRANPETHEPYTVKDLRKVRKRGIPLERVLVVEDSPEKLERHYGNHIRLKAFEGDATDRELPLLAEYLRRIRDAPNYRALEKRQWRAKVSGSA
jgi:RNA polymerase II subunit A small phosphatase-like protein